MNVFRSATWEEAAMPDRHEEIARCLFRESNDALFLFDPKDHRVVDVNPVALRLSGFDKKTTCQMRVWDLFRGADPQAVEQLIEAYQISWFYHSREGLYLNRSSGTSIPVNVSVSRIHTQPEPLGLVVARDITERKRAQDTLDRFFRLAPDLFTIMKEEGGTLRYVCLNPAWEQVLGYQLDELIVMSPFELIHPEERTATEEIMDRLRRNEEVREYEQRLCHQDGSYRSVSWNVTMVEGYVYAVGRDITEQMHAETLRRAMEAAELANRAKSDFLANISHEIRTPMSAILAYTDLLLESTRQGGTSRQLDDLQIIRRNAEHLLALLDDLLDLSKVEAGTVRVTPDRCSVSRLLRDAIEMVRADAEAKGLQLEVACRGPVPESIWSDPTRVRQILINLLGNAVKFTDRGGIRVELRLEAAVDTGPHLWFSVTDSGPGMTPEEAAHLFTPFHRAGRHNASGSGLGLAISQRLALLLRGRIEVQTTPGVGSVFALSLPTGPLDDIPRLNRLELDDSVPDEPHAPPAPPPRLDARVLVAEDRDELRFTTVFMLEQAGATVVSVKNGRAAVETAVEARDQGQPFDAILMDMRMPIVDGFEATRQLRDQGLDCLILALTAYAAPEDREECLQLGCDEHIRKPIEDWPRLIKLIAAHQTKRGTP